MHGTGDVDSKRLDIRHYLADTAATLFQPPRQESIIIDQVLYWQEGIVAHVDHRLP